MSGAAVPVVGKVLAGAIVGKTVGKVTGNDKLGMLAALGAGIAVPGSTFAGMGESAGGLLTTGAELVEEYPGAARIAGGLASGAAQGAFGAHQEGERIRAEKQAALKAHEREMERMEREAEIAEEARAADYARTHQDFGQASPTARYSARPTGLLRDTGGGGAAEDYYSRFRNLYSAGVL